MVAVGKFSNRKYQFGYMLERLGMENSTAIWYNLWPLVNFCCHLAHLPYFGMFYQEKFDNPGVTIFYL
jgi:hypothetical protein